MHSIIESHRDEIQRLCRQFGVQSLDVFGSAAGETFDPQRSDIDFVVDFGPGAQPDLFNRYFGLNEALAVLLGRKVDLVVPGGMVNPYFIDAVIRLHWSPLILDELSRALVDAGRKPDRAAARRHEQLMRASLPQADIPTADVQAQFASVTPAMRSTKDTHVAACAHAILVNAYHPGTQVVSLVTKNIRDFGVRKLATLGIDVLRPDALLLDRDASRRRWTLVRWGILSASVACSFDTLQNEGFYHRQVQRYDQRSADVHKDGAGIARAVHGRRGKPPSSRRSDHP